ncbi:hypothetical protein ACFL2Q_16820 [Thermodesulfobacteriota bacterium]
MGPSYRRKPVSRGEASSLRLDPYFRRDDRFGPSVLGSGDGIFIVRCDRQVMVVPMDHDLSAEDDLTT